MAARCQRLPWWRHALHIAVYLPFGAEIDPLTLTAAAGSKRFYVPVVGQRRKMPMTFAALDGHCRWHKSNLGMREPVVPRQLHIHPGKLDLVIVPLLGFDDNCNRIGQGGGYYDRSFAFLRTRHMPGVPRLVGVAFECQRVDTLQLQPWDVPLDAVVTERHTRRRRFVASGSNRDTRTTRDTSARVELT